MSAPSYAELRQYLLAIEQDRPEDHRVWVEVNLPRFARTLELVPEGAPGQRCLELGARPFTFTVLLKRYRPFELSLVDYFDTPERVYRETVRIPSFGDVYELTSSVCDVEREALPFADCGFAGVLCCELLEHLTADPVAMLRQIHRVLEPGGWLILTTPNVANIGNVLHLVHGRNVYHAYEATFGPTWRHNREYTSTEVADLLRGTGFAIERLLVENASPPGARAPLLPRLLEGLLGWYYRIPYGHQIYALARRGPEFHDYRPAWLYTGSERNAGLLGGRLSPT